MTSSLPTLLVLNPNTSASITALLLEHARREAGDRARVEGCTARLGAPYIASEAACAIAAHSALDAWAGWRAAHPAPQGLLIGCFGDPGLFALREVCDCPVTGLAEAAFREAQRTSGNGRFAVVTGGAAWGPMLDRLARGLGLDDALAGIHTVAPSGAALAADPQSALPLLAQACREAARATGAGSVILGGAGLAGMAARLRDQVPVPLVDSVEAGVRAALAASEGPPGPIAGARAKTGLHPGDWAGLDPVLARCLCGS